MPPRINLDIIGLTVLNITAPNGVISCDIAPGPIKLGIAGIVTVIRPDLLPIALDLQQWNWRFDIWDHEGRLVFSQRFPGLPDLATLEEARVRSIPVTVIQTAPRRTEANPNVRGMSTSRYPVPAFQYPFLQEETNPYLEMIGSARVPANTAPVPPSRIINTGGPGSPVTPTHANRGRNVTANAYLATIPRTPVVQGNLAEATTREGARGRDESEASQYSQDVEEEADEEADDEADEELQEADTEAASQGEDSQGTPRPRATVQSVGSGKLT